MKKYTIGQETFYLQELPLMDKPSPSGSFSLSRAELDFNSIVENLELSNKPYVSEQPIVINCNKKFISANDDIGVNNKFSKDKISSITEEDNYTVERYIENEVAKVIIRYQKDEDGKGLILIMDEADMKENGFK
jgi:hypothetical protein